jgi:anti-anti-sigma factor
MLAVPCVAAHSRGRQHRSSSEENQPMEIGESHLGGIVVLHPQGRIDGISAPDFQARLLRTVQAGGEGVVVDMAAVDYISSAGLRALMAAARQRKETRLAVASLSPVVQEIFTIARFRHVLPIFGSPDEAAAAWGAPPQTSS